jgi:hypothetical protein
MANSALKNRLFILSCSRLYTNRLFSLFSLQIMAFLTILDDWGCVRFCHFCDRLGVHFRVLMTFLLPFKPRSLLSDQRKQAPS